MTYTQAAVYDAVVAIEGRYQPYGFSLFAPGGASPDAAVAQAAHDVLSYYLASLLTPAQVTQLDSWLSDSLAAIPDGQSKTDGISVGHAAAQGIIAQEFALQYPSRVHSLILGCTTCGGREGIRADGAHLYPAFPYPSFTLMTDADILDIKAYIFSLPPVAQQSREQDLWFPASWRWLQTFWRWLNFIDCRCSVPSWWSRFPGHLVASNLFCRRDAEKIYRSRSQLRTGSMGGGPLPTHS